MIGLVLSMIGARRAQAVTVWLLSAIATAAAVAGPVALRTVDRAVVRQEVGVATSTERSISVVGFANPTDGQAAGGFDAVASLAALPGFEVVRSGELQAFGPVPDGRRAEGSGTSRVVFRDRVCEHIQLVRGRCPAGPLEVLVGADTAGRLGLDPGDVTVVQAARAAVGAGLIPDGPETRLSVVGLYRPVDPGEAYWAGQRYFPVTADGTRVEPIFLSAATFDLIGHTVGQMTVDVYIPADRLTLERVATLRQEIENVRTPILDAGEFVIQTNLPELLDRIATSRGLAGQLVPVAFVPLVGLCWFVIYLAVSAGFFGRRAELGLVTLRGVRPVRRWSLATGETALAIVAGAPVGYVLGHLAVGSIARARLGGADGAQVGLAGLRYALIALAGALVVAVLGQRSTLRTSVVDLLRGVPRRGAMWRTAAVEGVVLALAVVATVQLRTAGQGGVALLVPGLVVAGMALLAGRTLIPLAAVVARRALRRGRLGAGLAAVQMARRPGSNRLFVLLTVAMAMLAFVAAGVDVAGQAREDRAHIATGATRVATVDGANPARLLSVTRRLDPAGEWAMAAVPVIQTDPAAPDVLAVDATRLGVAEWHPGFLRGGPAAVRALGEALRGSLAKSFELRGTTLVLDLDRTKREEDPPLDVTFTFAPLAGGDEVGALVSELGAGRVTRRVDVPACAEGCRLTGITVRLERSEELQLRVHSIRQLDPPGEVVPAADLAHRDRWRPGLNARVASVGGELAILGFRSPFDQDLVRVAAVDAQFPVPVAVAGVGAGLRDLTSLDGGAVGVKIVSQPTALPRLGSTGVLMDLEYLNATMLTGARRVPAEVWLGPRAPADAPERLRQAGLAVSRTTGIEASQRALERQGPALAMHFHAAAATLGLLLALGGLVLVATVDRRRQADDLAALRRQGLPRRFVRRAAAWGYLSIVVGAGAAGLAAAAVAWLAAGDQLPIFTDTTVVPPPRAPDWLAVLVPWALALAALVAVSVVIGWALRRTVGRGVANGRR